MAYSHAHMPSKTPLKMVYQDFGKRPNSALKPARYCLRDHAWRFAAFIPAVITTIIISIAIAEWLSGGGVTTLEIGIVALVSLTFIWISLSVSTATLGLARRAFFSSRRIPLQAGQFQKIALLVPIYNEVTADVFGNAAAMLAELEQCPRQNQFDLFILSDTTDPAIAAQEEHAFFLLQAQCALSLNVYYRRRRLNTDKKVGNLTDWIENWGGAYHATIILDADSLMTGAAIRNLVRAMDADPEAGLIQSFPLLVGSETLFGRMQQFSNTVYGWLQAEGLALWSQREGNYWGHNAIIRTRAFAESARLPYLKGRAGREELILSHDFVEAGMLRRAGWAVRFMPHIGGSYEETPQTLIDYALRDRRWCRGNLQHLRLLMARGFHPVSRFHLLQGALAFLMSPAWFALIVIWAVLGTMPEDITAYFNASNPLFPIWPIMPEDNGYLFLAMVYAMLLMPKITSAVALGFRPGIRKAYGGKSRFWATVIVEIIYSILFAPIMMVQQSIAVAKALVGQQAGWFAQNRSHKGYSWTQALYFHWVEVCIGLILSACIISGFTSLWLTPVMISLTLAPALSKLSCLKIRDGMPSLLRLECPNSLQEPRIFRHALEQRSKMRQMLEQSEAQIIAAE